MTSINDQRWPRSASRSSRPVGGMRYTSSARDDLDQGLSAVRT